MSFPDVLNIVTLVVSTITMIIVTLALLPQLKQGMAVARDIVLWAALILVVSAVTMIGWNRYGGLHRRDEGYVPSERQDAGDSDRWSDRRR
jgi:hypothetical protein